MLIQLLINTTVQLVLFSSIPLIWWFVTARKSECFLTWIGLTKPKCENTIKTLIIIALTFLLLLCPVFYLIFSFEDKSVLATTGFAGLGVSGIVPVILYAVFQTGLSEEILFRGFLNKRLSAKFGFIAGNIIQAVLFGVLHGILLINGVSIPLIVSIVIFTAAVGWLMGFINEKYGSGSIVPSWAIHSAANIVTASVFLFSAST